MKVTALIPDDIIAKVKQYTNGKNITESLIKALEEYIALQNIKELNQKIEKEPLEFQKGFSAKKIRSINQRG